MTARAYYVDGVQLVNVGGELCESCEQRPGVGHSIGGSVICARCAGWAAREASEYAAEVEASRVRREAKRNEQRAGIEAALARFHSHDNSQSTKTGRPRRISMTRPTAGNHEGAAAANAKKSEHQRGIRHAAVLGAMQQLRTPQTSMSLAVHTGLSLATVKRTVHELLHSRQLTAKRAHKSSAYLYSLRRAS